MVESERSLSERVPTWVGLSVPGGGLQCFVREVSDIAVLQRNTEKYARDPRGSHGR
jgi:hypothetical protein